VRNTTISGNSGHCIWFKPTASGSTKAVIRDSRIDHCGGQGIRTDASGTSGPSGGGFVQTHIFDTTVSFIALTAVSSISGAATFQSNVLFQNSRIEYTTGTAVSANGAVAALHLAGSTIMNTNTAIAAAGGGGVFSYGDNVINFNVSPGTTPIAQPLR